MNIVSTASVLPHTPADVNDMLSVVFVAAADMDSPEVDDGRESGGGGGARKTAAVVDGEMTSSGEDGEGEWAAISRLMGPVNELGPQKLKTSHHDHHPGRKPSRQWCLQKHNNMPLRPRILALVHPR